MTGIDTRKKKNFCLGSRTEVDLLLQWIEEFITVFSDKPHFTFTHFVEASHDGINDISRFSNRFMQFFQRVHQSKLFEHTAVILFGDHGMRYGDFSRTTIGRMEKNLPALYVILPQYFRDNFPNAFENIKINSERLVTNFDVRETLNDILHQNYKNVGKLEEHSHMKIGQLTKRTHFGQEHLSRSLSLFKIIPESRTCEDATIEYNRCQCAPWTNTTLDTKTMQLQANHMALFLVTNINSQLEPASEQCATLTLKSVVAIRHANFPKIVRTSERTDAYSVILETFPGGGVFEAVMIRHYTQYKLVGEISRINAYGNQSHCIKIRSLREFCYCKDLLRNSL